MDKWPSTEDSGSKPTFSKRIENAPLMDGPPSSGSKAKYIGLVCLGLIILGILLYVGSQALTGYAVYGAMQQSGVPAQYATDMSSLATAKAAAEADAKSARDELAAAQAQMATERDAMAQAKAKNDDALSAAANANAAMQANLDHYKTSLEQTQTELNDKTAALSDTARRVCCAQRAVSDPSINSYSITDGKVVCGSDGSEPLSC